MDTGVVRIDPALLAALLTSAGAPVAAGVVTGVVEFLKSLFPRLSGHEKQLAFLLAGLVLAAAYGVGLTVTPPYTELTAVGLLALPLAWYNVGRLSMAVHDDFSSKPGSLREPSAEKITAEMNTSPTVRAGGELPGGSPPPDDATPPGVAMESVVFEGAPISIVGSGTPEDEEGTT